MTKIFDSGIYRVVENPDIKDAAIELKEETKWNGLVYQYGKVQMEDGKPNSKNNKKSPSRHGINRT
mgnify:CR=1 FL=1